MKKALILLAFLLAGCAPYRPMPMEEMVIQKELEVPGMTRDRIFKKSKEWITRHFYSKDKIIQYEDKEAGVIIAAGYVDYPATGKLEAIEKVQHTISFRMREEIRDSRITVTFGDLLLHIPRYYRRSRFWPMQEYTGGYSVPIEERSDFEAAKRGLLEIADRLGECLEQNRGE